MIFSPTLIAATAQPLSGSTPREGLGRVERQTGPATYVIALGREKMTVQITSGALKEGQQVSIAARSNGLIIMGLDTGAREGGKNGEDSFLPSGASTRPELQSVLDSMISSLSRGTTDPLRWKQTEVLFSTVAGELSAIDPKLTGELRALLGALSSAGANGGDETVATALSLLERLKNLIPQSTIPADGRFLIIKQSLPEGLYAFTTVEEALRFLSTDATADPALAGLLRAALDADGVIIIKTSTFALEQTVASLLRPDDLARELASWNAASISRVFQSIPTEVFGQLFIDRGNVPLQSLRLLDAYAAALQLPAASPRAGSREARDAALLQWLRAAVDSRAAPSALAALAPVFSSSSIIDGLGDLAAVAKNSPAPLLPLPGPEAFGLTAAGVRPASSGPALFDAMIAKMGFNLENTLAAGGTPDSAGLKQLLRQFMHAVDTAVGAGPAAKGTATRQEVAGLRAAFERALLSITEQSLSLPAPAPNKLDGDVRSALSALFSHASNELQSQLQPHLSTLWTTIDGLVADAGRLSGASTGKEVAARPALPSAIVEAFIRDAGVRTETALQQLTEAIERTVRQYLPVIIQQIVSASAAHPSLFPGNVIDALGIALEKGLATLFAKGEELGPLLARTVETLLREALREGPAHPAASVKSAPEGAKEPAAPAPPGKTAAETLFFDRAALRQNLEAMTSRLESQQLLSRTSPSASGEQQILALPVKIGGEWTEMHLRFIRHHLRKGGGDRGHYSVYVNVAPALLGAIDARLEYQQNRSLSIAIEFESAATHAWFLSKKNDIRQALRALGVPSPRIELLAPRANTVDDTSAFAPLIFSSTIDLKA
jgi:hypothetical protein